LASAIAVDLVDHRRRPVPVTDPPSPDATSDVALYELGDRPVGIADVELAVLEGEAVVFDVQASMVHHLNAIAAATWLCCDGETSVTEIIDELADVFAVTDSDSLDALAGAVHNSLERLAAEGLLADRPVPRRSERTHAPVLADDGTEVFPAPPDP
jgi:hypothetical protein